MGFTNFNEVSQAIALINAALAPNVYIRPNLDINTDLASENRRAIAINEIAGEYNFYISTNISGTWQWEPIGSGGLTGDGLYRVTNDTTERDSIPLGERVEGMVVFVLSTKSEHRLLGGITNNDWVVDEIIVNIPAGDPGTQTITVGNVTKHKALIIDYTVVNNPFTATEVGTIKLTSRNDTKIVVVSNFDDLEISFIKQINGDDINIKIENYHSEITQFHAKIKWFYV